MKKKFSTYVDILEQDDIEHVMKASKNDFTYMLKEFAAWRDKSPGEKHVARKSMTPQQRKALEDYEDAQSAESDPYNVPPESKPVDAVPTDNTQQGMSPEELSDAEPVETTPEEPIDTPPVVDAPPKRSEVPQGTPKANSPGEGILGKTLGGLKKAGQAIDSGVNWLASGQPTGSDPKQLSSVMKSAGDPGSQEIIDTLVAQVPQIASNPAIGDRLVNLLQQKTGVKPTPTVSQESAGKFNENWRDSLKKIAGGVQSGASWVNKLGTATKNLHQATGGRDGTQGSQMTRLATGELQRTNEMKTNYHDFLKTAINKPEALDDHPTWVDFMQTSTPAQKQAFMDYIQQSVQQYSGPTPPTP